MPRAARKPEEIEIAKKKILKHALDLIVRHGYEGFSMRKLADPLGIAAKTIYNYFRSKDEVYLLILTRGFDDVYRGAVECYEAHGAPLDRLEAMVQAFLDFGTTSTNLYNLMFTWHVPKYRDYVGTEMESTARLGLEAGLRLSGFFMKAIQECGTKENPISDEQARFFMVRIWSQMHGFIAGYNNTFLDYMHDDPIKLKDSIAELIVKSFRTETSLSQE